MDLTLSAEYMISLAKQAKQDTSRGGKQRVPLSAYSSTIKTKQTYSSETSVDFQRTAKSYIPDDTLLRNRPYENLSCCLRYYFRHRYEN
jgi:hypothetical protein